MKRRGMAGALVGLGAVAAGLKECLPHPVQAAPGNPDAALIAACKLYPAVVAAEGACEGDGNPADLAHTEVCAIIDSTPPQTMAGVLAKARAASCNKQTWAELRDWGGWEEDWAGEVAFDLLRLAKAGLIGGAA